MSKVKQLIGLVSSWGCRGGSSSWLSCGSSVLLHFHLHAACLHSCVLNVLLQRWKIGCDPHPDGFLRYTVTSGGPIPKLSHILVLGPHSSAQKRYNACTQFVLYIILQSSLAPNHTQASTFPSTLFKQDASRVQKTDKSFCHSSHCKILQILTNAWYHISNTQYLVE